MPMQGYALGLTLFCCGGDRNFFRENDVHPAEFLRIVKRAGEEDQAIVDWVVARRKNIDSLYQRT